MQYIYTQQTQNLQDVNNRYSYTADMGSS